MRNGTRRNFWNRCFLVWVTSVGFGCLCCAQDHELCTEINSVIGYKIVLDDIHFNSGSTGPQERQLMDLLNAQLGGRLQESNDQPDFRYHLVRCNGRVPQGEASFPPLTMKDLVNRDVVLELWGEIFAPRAGKYLVFLNYVMLPLPPASVSPFLQRQYQLKVGSSPDEIVAWLADLNELDAYAKAARAIRLLSVKGPAAYDNAKADLESASSSLRPAFGNTPTGAQLGLLKFLLNQKCEILRDARTNSDYKGPLRLLPDAVLARECPAGGGL